MVNSGYRCTSWRRCTFVQHLFSYFTYHSSPGRKPSTLSLRSTWQPLPSPLVILSHLVSTHSPVQDLLLRPTGSLAYCSTCYGGAEESTYLTSAASQVNLAEAQVNALTRSQSILLTGSLPCFDPTREFEEDSHGVDVVEYHRYWVWPRYAISHVRCSEYSSLSLRSSAIISSSSKS